MSVSRMAGLAFIAVSVFGPVAADAQPLPHQRLGLWHTDIAMAGNHMSMQSCVDAASEAQNSIFSAAARKNGHCQQQQLTHNLDGSWTSISTCQFGPSPPRTTRADVAGDFNSKVTMTMRSPPSAPPETTMTMTWVGPCEPGMRGGDVVMSNGMKMNTMDAMRGH